MQNTTTYRRVYAVAEFAMKRAAELTYTMARAAATDAGNRSMRKAGRTAWSRTDYNAAAKEFNRLCPEG